MVKEALIEFKNLGKNKLYSIQKIEWWLLKYGDYYKDLKSYWVCPNERCCHRDINYCECESKSEEYILIELFKRLDEFTKYHRREGYAMKEMVKYENVKKDRLLLKEWVRENEKIGADECFEFLINHHNYSTSPNHLLIFTSDLLGYEVFIDRSGFSNLMEFMEVFSKLFWEDEIYPESEILVRIKKELEL